MVFHSLTGETAILLGCLPFGCETTLLRNGLIRVNPADCKFSTLRVLYRFRWESRATEISRRAERRINNLRAENQSHSHNL